MSYVYAIHTVKPDDATGAVEVIHTNEQDAREYARDRSTDHTITSASVTRYTLAELGTRHPLALYADGKELPRPDRRGPTARLYPTG